LPGQSRLTKAFGLTGADAWQRHPNPWSVYTRLPIPLLLLTVAIAQTALQILGKLWFLDRMALLYDDAVGSSGEVRPASA
jgi:hypothetical protein